MPLTKALGLLSFFLLIGCGGPKKDFSRYLGEPNEFGLIQLTRCGHPNIVNNYACEDNYIYTEKNGRPSPKGKHGDDWTTPRTAELFLEALNALLKNSEHQYIRVIVNDVSAYNPKKDLGHKTHFWGNAIDMRFLTTNGIGSNDINTLSEADIALNAQFIKELRRRGFSKIFSHLGKIPGSTHVPGHHNHLHIGR